MQDSAAEAEELLKAMANRHRLVILCQLIDSERSVGELAGILELHDANVSQHLALLRKDGLVTTRRDGQTIWYSIASEPARKLVEDALSGVLRAQPDVHAKNRKGKVQPMTVKNLDATEVARLLKQDAIVLIDVREPDEYAAERIPGALSFPLSAFDPQSLPDPGGRLWCSNAARESGRSAP